MMRWLIWVGVLLAGTLGWAHWPDRPLPADARADRVIVHKSARTLELLRGGTVLKSYRISLGRHPVGPKEREGDGRTPEGAYVIDSANAASAFHRALHISYPSGADRERAASLGVNPGGLVMIHGMKNGLGWIGRLHRFVDWTNGCVAVDNAEMDEIWRAVPVGTPIELRP